MSLSERRKRWRGQRLCERVGVTGRGKREREREREVKSGEQVLFFGGHMCVGQSYSAFRACVCVRRACGWVVRGASVSACVSCTQLLTN